MFIYAASQEQIQVTAITNWKLPIMPALVTHDDFTTELNELDALCQSNPKTISALLAIKNLLAAMHDGVRAYPP